MLRVLSLSILASFAFAAPTSAQTSGTTAVYEDEVIVMGKRQTSGNTAMRAFNAGDFETAEIEFGKHYTALRRSRRAVANSARDGAASSVTAQIRNGSPQISGGGGGAAGTEASSVDVSSSRAANGAGGVNPNLSALVIDGDVSDQDFSFARYMTGLSQIQLGKYSEAKLSFEQALDFNGKNYDARMRLGLLELRDGQYDRARKQLVALNKIRKTCYDPCEAREEMTAATKTLASALAARS